MSEALTIIDFLIMDLGNKRASIGSFLMEPLSKIV